MKRILTVVAALVLALPVLASSQQASQSAAKGANEQRLIQLDKDLETAINKADTAALGKLLTDNFKQTDRNGRTIDKSQFLSRVKESAGKSSQAKSGDYDVTVSGTTAIVSHLSTQGDGTSRQQVKSTHVWTRTGSQWRLSATTSTVVREPTATTPAVLECSTSSFEAEVFQFYGDPATIVQKLQGDRVDVAHRRVYLLMLETEGSAELVLFERQPDDHGRMKVARWRGESVSDLREELTNVLLANKGIACTGEQSKQIINARYNITDRANVFAPASAQGAFSHSVKRYGTSYVRATVFLFC